MGQRTLCLLTLFALACGSDDKGGSSPPVDADGDGFTTVDDCDDTNNLVYPGAEEACDGVDNDCDGDADLDDQDVVGYGTWYIDSDLDGYGDAGYVTNACEKPENGTDDATDCDDRDDTVNPGAEELCDGVDNDCDDLIDSEDTLVTGISTWAPDEDGDGYGDSSQAVIACDNPNPDFVENGLDCDDTNVEVNPETPEICGDGVDWDCDGSDSPLVFRGDTTSDCARAAFLGVGDAAVGDRLAAGYDLSGDSVADLAVAGTNAQVGMWSTVPVGSATLAEGDATIDMLLEGEIFVATGPTTRDATVNGLVMAVAQEYSQLWVVAGPIAGPIDPGGRTASLQMPLPPTALLLPGSMDADDRPDLLLGVDGHLALVRGPLEGVLFEPSNIWEPEIAATVSALADAQDLNGDGDKDIIVGLTTDDEGGGVALLFGPWTDNLPEDAVWEDGDTGSQLGASVAGGLDVNDDGYTDVLVGAPGMTVDEMDGAGVTYLLYGPMTDGISITSAVAQLTGESDGDAAGSAVALMADFNGDEFADYAIGAPGYADGDGRGYIVFGPVFGEASLADVAYSIDAHTSGQALGSSVVSSPDLGGDTRTEVLFGAPGAGELGAAYLFFGGQP